MSGTGTLLTDSAKDNRYTYTGREWDKTIGLYHYRARMYDPESGRFVSCDLIGYEGSEWSLYQYVESNPLNRLDFDGLQSTAIRPDVLIAAGLSPMEIAEALGISVAAATALVNAHKLKEAVDKLVENFIRNAKGKDPCELAESAVRQAERAIAAYQAVIAKHQGWINDPSTYPGTVRNVASARAAWLRDIQRAQDNIMKTQKALDALRKAAHLACWCWYNPGRW